MQLVGSTMVQQTRRVVEDYVLYKIHSALSHEDYNAERASPYINSIEASILMNGLPLPQQSPSKLNLALRSIAGQYERKYKETFPDLLNEMRTMDVSESEVDAIFSRICKDLFHLPLKQIPNKIENLTATNKNTAALHKVTFDDSHIKWGHVIALFVFAGTVAVRAVECRTPEKVDDIVNWVTRFLDTELSPWILKQGGWENFVEWSKASVDKIGCAEDNGFDPNLFNAGIRSVMSVGVLAACVGLGALMIKKL